MTLGTPHHGAPLERGGTWIDTLLGVSRYSALGRHADPQLELDFGEARRWVALGANHLDLLSRADVYAKLLELLP